jgi:hypothetical protein
MYNTHTQTNIQRDRYVNTCDKKELEENDLMVFFFLNWRVKKKLNEIIFCSPKYMSLLSFFFCCLLIENVNCHERIENKFV